MRSAVPLKTPAQWAHVDFQIEPDGAFFWLVRFKRNWVKFYQHGTLWYFGQFQSQCLGFCADVAH